MNMLNRSRVGYLLVAVAIFAGFFVQKIVADPTVTAHRRSFESKSLNRVSLKSLDRLASQNIKPFVIVKSSSKGIDNNGQGVLIATNGLVLTVGHIAWNDEKKVYADDFKVGFRTSSTNAPAGASHIHDTIFIDKEDTHFYQHSYKAELLKFNGSRFIDNKDIGLLDIGNGSTFPIMDFYSSGKPNVELGDVFYLCHYYQPPKDAEPTFLINPITVVGVVQTSSGSQVLASGYYRVGSSGSAILKNGKLIGIQSAAYTVNAKGIGEVPMGLVSFHLVYRDMFADIL